MTHTPAPALTAVLDELDGLRAEATPGEWYHDGPGEMSSQWWLLASNGVGKVLTEADAALIVAAVNRLPQLTAALRAVLDLADDWDRNAAIFPEYGDLSAAAAGSIRTAITTAMEAS